MENFHSDGIIFPESEPMRNSTRFLFFCMFAMSRINAQNDSTATRRFYPYSTVLDREAIQHLPVRSIDRMILLTPGITMDRGLLFVRGGQLAEFGYSVNGLSIFNPHNGLSAAYVIPEALQSIVVSRGSYRPGVFGGQAADVQLELRKGGNQLEGSLYILGDEVAVPGSEFLGTTVQGSKNFVATLGGPLLPNIYFFAAAEYSRTENKQPMFLTPFYFPGLVTDGSDSIRATGEPLPGDVEFQKNFLSENYFERRAVQGNVSANIGAGRLELTGSFESNLSPNGNGWSSSLQNIFSRQRALVERHKTILVGLRTSFPLTPSASVEASLGFMQQNASFSDPDFGDNWQLYADSLANAKRGYDGFQSRYIGPAPFSTIDHFVFYHPNTPNNIYGKEVQRVWQGELRGSMRLNEGISFVGGIHFEWWTMKTFSVNNILGYCNTLSSGVFSNAAERRFRLKRAGSIVNYGYNYEGNESSDGIDHAFSPHRYGLFGALEYSSKFLSYSMGLQIESFDFAIPLIDQNGTTKSVSNEILPRAIFSLHLNEHTDLEAGAGLFVSHMPLWLVYNFAAAYSPSDGIVRLPLNNINLGASPPSGISRITQVDVSISSRADWISARSGFYLKSIRNEYQPAKIYGQTRNDFSIDYRLGSGPTVYGIELLASLRLWPTVKSTIQYVFADLGEDSVYDFRARLSPERLPRATIRVSFEFDSKEFEPAEKPAVYGQVFICSSSGKPYTRLDVPRVLGGATPWNFGLPNVDRNLVIKAPSSDEFTTPWVVQVDAILGLRQVIYGLSLDLSLQILNIFNTKNVLAVYPTTGIPNDDGWLRSPLSASYKEIANYTSFYRAINDENHWAYTEVTGKDLYGEPRQFRLGLRVNS
jgi:hypothetical protein